MSVGEKIRRRILSWLNFEDIDGRVITIRNGFDFESNAIKNRLWYRGDANELQQFYEDIRSERAVDRLKFWGAVCTKGLEIQKRHTGIPGLIVDTLSDVTLADFEGFEFGDKEKADSGAKAAWEDIAEENSFKTVLEDMLKTILYIGDGAFKISIDTNLSENPIIEFVSGENIDVTMKRGRITELIFKSTYTQDLVKYELQETYGYGYVTYKLLRGEHEVPLDTVPALADLADVAFGGGTVDEEGNVAEKGGYMMAVYVKRGKSDKWPGRGMSLFDRKIDSFDALDEVWSQWMDALRAGRTKEYIPEDLIPRNPENGALAKPNAFDFRFIATGNNMAENGQNKIDVESPAIQHESYSATYITALDLCLQGIISPSTLGIDTKKLDNAEAQREKEKTTLYTRQKIIDILETALPALVDTTLKVKANMNEETGRDISVKLKFGEYANPSFEAQAETVGKAKTQGIMSVDAAVEELYGDSKDDAWKKKEVERIKAEQGIEALEEPAVREDLIDFADDEADEDGDDKDDESKGEGGKQRVRDDKSGVQPPPADSK